MSRNVFILGAGASKEAGGPLMAEFLDIADGLRRSPEVGEAKESFDLVFKAISALQAVHSKASLDLDNIESVFAAFEMAILFDRHLGNLPADEVRRLPVAIRRLIVKTLESRISFRNSGRQVLPPVPYDDFTDLILSLRKGGQDNVSVLTFNYDLCLDYALHFAGAQVDYGLTERGNGFPLIKLHGSLNWTRCSVCEAIVPWTLGEFFARHNWNLLIAGSDKPCRLTLTEHIPSSVTHCDKPMLGDPAIVPPTWNKTQHQQEIAKVWCRAAQELSEAENIFVIGYSLPETDQFFRYLFALGTVGDALLKRFWVFNPDDSGIIKRRFEELLGQMGKKRFKYFPSVFKGTITPIRRELAGQV